MTVHMCNTSLQYPTVTYVIKDEVLIIIKFELVETFKRCQ